MKRSLLLSLLFLTACGNPGNVEHTAIPQSQVDECIQLSGVNGKVDTLPFAGIIFVTGKEEVAECEVHDNHVHLIHILK